MDNLEDARPVTIFFLGAAVCSLFLLFGMSRFLWETIPFFEYIQFPARWLHITVFTLVFLSSVVFLVLDTMYKANRGHSLYIVLFFLICLLLDFNYIYSAPTVREQNLMPAKAANMNFEHLPRWVSTDKISRDSLEERVAIHSEGEVRTVSWKSAERIFIIAAKRPLTIMIRTFYFPGWKAYVDDRHVALRTETGSGAMIVDIPQGNHKLVLRFEDTPIRYYSKIISIVSFSVILLGVLISKRRGKISNEEEHYES